MPCLPKSMSGAAMSRLPPPNRSQTHGLLMPKTGYPDRLGPKKVMGRVWRKTEVRGTASNTSIIHERYMDITVIIHVGYILDTLAIHVKYTTPEMSPQGLPRDLHPGTCTRRLTRRLTRGIIIQYITNTQRIHHQYTLNIIIHP